ncbi:MAG TPA: T9SS type A sorting domain-containing protein, partial [Bacteroidia bacterium]|nr:T9SS type A sorting domain-containing protein [Bacteroidia bacterium]
FGLECDDLNRVYLVGHAASANNIATAGAYQDSTWGLDAYLAVFDGVSGSRIWATYFGGAFYESFTDVSVDADYNIYCSGRTFSSSNVASSGAHQTIYGGINFADVALVKFDSSGTRLWSTYFGGSGDDFGLGVRAANGYVYVAGQTFSPNNISSFNAYQATYGGNGDGYYARFLDSGVLTYASYYGDTSTQVFEDIVVDLSGRTFVCGSTNSPTGGTPGTHQQNYGGQIDGSLSCFDSFGSPAWTTYYGGNFYDDLKSIALVDNTLIFSVGTTTSFNNIATPGVHQSSKMGVDDAYMVKFSQLLPSIGIDENEGRTSLAVYPNPVTAGQEINFSSALPVQAIFKMYSISGQVVFESIINDSKVVLPARKFPKGEYQFTISDKNNLIGSGKISYQ